MQVGGFFWLLVGFLVMGLSTLPLGQWAKERFKLRLEAGWTLDALKAGVLMLILTPGGVGILAKAFEFPMWSWDILPIMRWALGFFILWGHCFSPWEQSDEGRGVVVLFGILAFLSPIAMGAALVAMASSHFLTGSWVNANLIALLTIGVVHLVLTPAGAHLWVLGAMAFVVLIRHEQDLDRLLESV